jgi:hypothetical protein
MKKIILLLLIIATNHAAILCAQGTLEASDAATTIASRNITTLPTGLIAQSPPFAPVGPLPLSKLVLSGPDASASTISTVPEPTALRVIIIGCIFFSLIRFRRLA